MPLAGPGSEPWRGAEADPPLVTAVMITGKSAERYPMARRAARCFLDQTYPNTELLVVNDGEELLGVDDPRVRELRVEKGALMNKGDIAIFLAKAGPLPISCADGTNRSGVRRGFCYHALNRGNHRETVFHKPADYDAFVGAMADACVRTPMDLLGYCVMPNHFHLVLRPHADGDLSRWMQWLLTAHARRYHRHYGTTGHVWQGRFKAFPIAADEHLLTILRYVERNPLRAELVSGAEQWRWSSLADWLSGEGPLWRGEPPLRDPAWLSRVNEPLSAGDLNRLRHSTERGTPFGGESWTRATAERLGLESCLRPRGRPKRQPG